MTSEKKVLRVTKLMSCMHQGKIKAVIKCFKTGNGQGPVVQRVEEEEEETFI